MTDAREWLAARRPPPPGPLAAAMAEAIDRVDAGPEPLADRLAGAGLDALRRVVEFPASRSAALELLAADALITCACEVAGEEGVDALGRLLDALDLERFAALLPGVADR